MKKQYNVKVDGENITFTKSDVTGREVLEQAGITPVDCYWLYQKLKGCDFERISLEEVVDLSNPGIEEFITKDTEVFNYTVNGEPETTDKKQLTPVEIMRLAGVDPGSNYLYQVMPDGSVVYYDETPNEPIVLKCPAMVFKTGQWLDIVDIEEYGKECREVPPARKYRIKIDKDYHVVDKSTVTHAELLQLAGKQPPDRYDVFKILSSHPKPVKIEPGERVSLKEKCLVRFVTMPKEQRDGSAPRRQFLLPADDTESLNKMGLLWETHLQGNHQWVLIHDYPIPDGYNVATCTIALMLPPMYPTTEIDMAYFYPALQKKSGRSISAITNASIDSKTYQRWSRHRNPGDWKPGVDNISTHLTLVDNWLSNDLKR